MTDEEKEECLQQWNDAEDWCDENWVNLDTQKLAEATAEVVMNVSKDEFLENAVAIPMKGLHLKLKLQLQETKNG